MYRPDRVMTGGRIVSTPRQWNGVPAANGIYSPLNSMSSLLITTSDTNRNHRLESLGISTRPFADNAMRRHEENAMHGRMNAWTIAACAALALMAACKTDEAPRSGPLETPVFADLETPGPNNTWDTITNLTPAPAILPTRGRGVRIGVKAPVGSTLAVSIRSGTGAPVALAQNTGSPAPPEAGYFQVVSTSPASPPVYRLYVRVPLALADPANYTIDIVNKSLRTDVTDSAPLSVALSMRTIFTVSVAIMGSGRVISNPPGITCGTAPSGAALTACRADFPAPVTVSLAPNSNGGGFKGWSGNCPPNDQTCILTLNGTSGFGATAHFGTPVPGEVSTCPTAQTIAGLRWIDIPDCATGVIDAHPGISHPAQCDAQGFFCCEPGGANTNSPRCGGIGKIESAPDCRKTGPHAMLRQPGGCYEIDEPP